MGWLGWTPGVTLAATLSEIELAYDGKLEMLESCFGSSASSDSKEPGDVKRARTPSEMASLLTGLMESNSDR